MLKKIFIGLLSVSIILAIGYISGPKASISSLEGSFPELSQDLSSIESYIQSKEDTVKGLKSGNEARIVWADAENPSKTTYSFLYIHGFGASSREGAPVHEAIAKHFNANLYLLRLPEHGINRRDAMKHLTAESLVAEVREAYIIAQKLGDEVIVIGTSMGGALALNLAAEKPEIKAVILYSPAIEDYGQKLAQFFQPWAAYMAERFVMKDGVNIVKREGEKAKYWSEQYHINGYLSLAVLLKSKMNKETFEKVKQPVFMGYYYKNEQEQDFVVAVKAMKEMYEQLGTASDKKVEKAFPESADHVIASDLTSKDWENVLNSSIDFLNGVLKNYK